MSARALLGGFVLATMFGLGAATSAAVAATAPGTIALYSDSGDFVGQGAQNLFDGPFTVQGNAGDVTVGISSGGQTWSLEFAAPPGQTLQPGIYDGAGRAPFRSNGQPGIDITGNSNGCNTDFGRLEVKDIATDASGVPDRLWLIFEQHCEGAQPALFGEVRLGEAPNGSPSSTTPMLVRWPARDYGTPETVVPVRFTASSPGSLSAASLGGADPSDYTIRSDDCAGRSLAAGGSCVVYVRFTPSVPGLRTATLVFRDGLGTAYSVPLQGWTYGGTTRLVMHSDAGDYVGNGQQYSFDPTNAVLEAAGAPEKVSFSIATDDWSGDFTPAEGDIFTTGSSWTGARRYPFQGTSPGMDVFGDGRGCNTLTGQFDVVEATYKPDGSMRTFGVTFEQHCEGAQPALRGEFDWRVGDTTPPAPWMSQAGGYTPTAPSGSSSGSASGSTTSAATVPTSTTGASKSAAASIPAAFSSSSTPGSKGRTLAHTLTLLRTDSARSAGALARLRHQPTDAHQRLRTADALNRLRRDVAAELHLLRSYRPRGQRLLAAWRRTEAALSVWEQALSLEQRSLGAARRAVAARIWQYDAGARLRQLAALKALAGVVQKL